jgi:hypothetical protein
MASKDNNSTKAARDAPQESAANESASGGGCPMKRGDGSYNLNISQLWKSPHLAGGKSKPLSQQEAEALSKTTTSDTNTTNNEAAANNKSGCPVIREYDVYSQPIDPRNNMPMANQMPSPNQTKPLSTERVQSTIPKVIISTCSDGALLNS